MKNRLRLIACIGSGALLAAGGFLLACGAEDTIVTAPDSGPIIDGGPDTQVTDTGVDAGFDGGFKVDTFNDVIADAVCRNLARCCYGTPTPADGGADGGSFDVASCKAYYNIYGFEGSNLGSELKDGGNVTIDQVAADSCIKLLDAVSCNLPGTQFEQIRAACFGAYQGKLAAGTTCHDSIECTKTNFCMLDQDAGDAGPNGKCQPLRGTNGNCGDFTIDPVEGESACSYRRSVNTGNYCDFYDFDGGGQRAQADWKCKPAVPVGSICASSAWCNASMCDDTYTCATPEKYFDQVCTKFLVP